MRKNIGFADTASATGFNSKSVRIETKLIHERSGRFSTIYVSEDASGLRTLRFGANGARQSVIDMHNPRSLVLRYTQAAMLALGLAPRPDRILVLGLGGGAIPMFLRHVLPTAQIDAVDIDHAVIDVAKRFLNFREDRKMHAYALDGGRFIALSRQSYDLIILDAFGLSEVPKHLTTAEFLNAVRSITTPSGLVVANLWGPALNPHFNAMLTTYLGVFPCVYQLKIAQVENRMVFAFPQNQSLTVSNLQRQLRRISSQLQLPFDLTALLDGGFDRLDQSMQDASIRRTFSPLK